MQGDWLAEQQEPASLAAGGSAAHLTVEPASCWHPNREIPGSVQHNAARCPDLLAQALGRLQAYGTQAQEAGISEQEWTVLEALLLPADDFAPGSLHLHREAWSLLLAERAKRDPKAAEVLSWVQQGYPLTFTSVTADSQLSKPGYQRKLDVVRSLLRQLVGPANVELYLQGEAPHPLHFPNLQSALADTQFVDEEVAKLKRLGTFIPLADLRPTCPWASRLEEVTISPLGVAINRKGKKRLVSPGTTVALANSPSTPKPQLMAIALSPRTSMCGWLSFAGHGPHVRECF